MSSMYCSTNQNVDLELVPKRRKDLTLENATKDSILERSKESPHFKLFWTLWLSLHASIFKMDKRKRFKLNLEIFRDIFKICPGVQGQDFDALPIDEEIISLSGKTTGLEKLRLSRAQILWGMYHQKNVDYVELLWEDFTKVIIHHFLTQDKTVSWRNKIGMHTSKDDYLINTLRFVFAKEETQIYGAILPESWTGPEMKEAKAYKTYLGFATGATPPKKARKFKKPASPKCTIVPVSTEEPTRKLKRVKRPANKSTKAPARGVVIRETPEMPLSKKKKIKKIKMMKKK
ncbi:hypothetical protein Tco_0836681 [Tanacetum coccineum]